MTQQNKHTNPEKKSLHPRNKHNGRYNFPQLIATLPELKPFVALNKFQEESIDFANPKAVKVLNKAILKHFYGIDHWDIPAGYLCPPIPGRADYIHYIADVLSDSNKGVIPKNESVRILDIGTGANCIYPLLGNKEYGWRFAGSDIDRISLNAAQETLNANSLPESFIELRHQPSPDHIFRGVIKPGETFDFTICNPPFHTSAQEANAGSIRKVKNLSGQKTSNPVLNFGGQNGELWCEGGEVKFVRSMIGESAELPLNCLWYSSLISKKDNLPGIYKALNKVKAQEVKTIEMAQGQKISRIVAWTFMDKTQQRIWAESRWGK